MRISSCYTIFRTSNGRRKVYLSVLYLWIKKILTLMKSPEQCKSINVIRSVASSSLWFTLFCIWHCIIYHHIFAMYIIITIYRCHVREPSKIRNLVILLPTLSIWITCFMCYLCSRLTTHYGNHLTLVIDRRHIITYLKRLINNLVKSLLIINMINIPLLWLLLF